MEDLSDVFKSPLPDSPYVKPYRLNYTQNGTKKNWDLLAVHDSVAIIVFNLTRKTLVLVKQFRPAVYYNSVKKLDRESGTIDTKMYPASLGLTLELCAGIVDKDKSWVEIAQDEILEECGYSVPLEKIIPLSKYRCGVGTEGSLQGLYYCEVDDNMKVNEGGGIDEEIIDVVELSLDEVRQILSSPGPHNIPPSCLYGLSWFMINKAPNIS